MHGLLKLKVSSLRGSLQARERETQSKNIYDKVYEAKRLEIFFKATLKRIVGSNDWVGIRSDSNWMVPEPELGIVLDSTGKIIGYIYSPTW